MASPPAAGPNSYSSSNIVLSALGKRRTTHTLWSSGIGSLGARLSPQGQRLIAERPKDMLLPSNQRVPLVNGERMPIETCDAIPCASGLVEYALSLQHRYEESTSIEERGRKGQYFTPPEVCSFMAGLFSASSSDTYRFLDPGAGVGSLTAALCERLWHIGRSRHIEAHLFENHPGMLPTFQIAEQFQTE